MEILGDGNKGLWQNFEKEFEFLPPQFLLKWKETLERTYSNCVGTYYSDKEEGKIKSVFPFLKIKSKIFGNKAISLPFIDFGGILGKFDRKFISEVVGNLKEDRDIKRIEIRLNDFSSNYKDIELILTELGFERESKKNQIILKLDSEDLLWNKFDRLTRKGIKKAEKSNLDLKEINNPTELIKFYDLYSKRMRDFGTPQHSYTFFDNLFNYFKDNTRGLNCYKDEKLIGSLIVFYSKNYMYAAYNFSESKYLALQPNDLLHWEIIKWAAKKGIEYFDMGQCEADAEEGTHAAGIYRFKSKWGGELYNKFYFSLNLNEEGGKSGNSNSNKYKKAVGIWKKLPLFITKKIGPKIASQLAL